MLSCALSKIQHENYMQRDSPERGYVNVENFNKNVNSDEKSTYKMSLLNISTNSKKY